MKKIICLVSVCGLVGCVEPAIKHNYVLEKYNGSEVPVCVDYPVRGQWVGDGDIEKYAFDEDGNKITCSYDWGQKFEKSSNPCDYIEPQVVSYSYCLEKTPHFAFKKKDDMTICYDRNNKVELPIMYCLPDTNVMNVQQTSVSVQQKMAALLY